MHNAIPDIFYKILIIVEALFLTGGIAIFIICLKKNNETRQKQWLKFWSYMIIVHAIIISLWFKSIFVALCFIIAIAGLMEIFIVSIRSEGKLIPRLVYIVLYCVFALSFIGFSRSASPQMILFVYLIVATFDAFSQITGQLFGRHRLAPAISPAKTIEGAAGGFLSSILLAAGLQSSLEPAFHSSILSGFIIAVSSITGDLSSSWYKRMNNVKDFSNWLPGQGGFIDRFNSFIFSAAIIFLITIF